MKYLKPSILFILLTFIIGGNLTYSQDLKGKVETFLSNKKISETTIKSILNENPSADTLIYLLQHISYSEPEQKGVVQAENICLDGNIRPFFWYIPDSYNPAQKTPLFVYLHGSVTHATTNSIKEKMEKKDMIAYVKRSPFFNLIEEKGYILLMPLGEAAASWWDEVGMTNVLSQIRFLKSRLNIDDNRVYMGGFSDGSSGSYYFAMNRPTDFAGFIPLNGHPTAAGAMAGREVYFVNLSNKPLHVIITKQDMIFSDKKIRPFVQLAKKAGGDITYRTYEGNHHFGYMLEEAPYIAKFMESHNRISNPVEIKWETAYPETGRCMWFKIDKINEDAEHSDWYQDDNMDVVNRKARFGFIEDTSYKENGVRVNIIPDKSFAAQLGMKKGDVITKMGDKNINTIYDYMGYIFRRKGGDSTKVTLTREGKEVILKGQFPDSTTYKLFKRPVPSARAEASYLGNTFYVKGSKLGAFTIYIHPDMVQLEQNVLVYFNNKIVFDQKIEPDREFLLRNFFENRDKELIYINKISRDIQ